MRTIAAALAAALLLVACAASTESSNVVRVAVLDAGVSSELPEFDCFRIVGAPPVRNDHGTAMAGLILGVLDDPCPPWSDRVVLDNRPVVADQRVGAEELALAIRAAVDVGAQLLNVSIEVPSDVPALRQAVDYAEDEGVIVVAAAGNRFGLRAAYPARYDTVISVGASDATTPASFSARRDVDVFADGAAVAVLTADGRQVRRDGTSVAAATVTHQVLQILLTDPGLTTAEVRDALATDSTPPVAPGG